MFSAKDNTDVKGRILEVARRLFIEKGYNGTSIREIAAASETNVAMINYYYHSKYNLFEYIFEEAFDVVMNRVFSVLRSDLPILELIEEWIDSYYESLMEYPQIPIFILYEVNQHPERLPERIKRREPYDIFLKISKRLEEEAQQGNIRETSVLDLLLNILSLCIFPFIFGSLAVKVTGRSMDEYHEVLVQHKDYVKRFVIQALKP
ncbi:TetR/AcrR family transcriptional regulator [Parabacteroides sp. PFB2-12]|uniref:TetR/AcrR family transcriptional regulator n=1 Tax=unclassified Parabacteroides TaxID=2649774 RepID=UPI002474CFBF|nr:MULTISPECIES: TetR family transcriptional regulator [unclassified Parabacteroides]MDH6343709.1 TetR/AcrR family transcriptional regulator [Parabacteroides sp. PM6-13]MDH6391345.1 TetR/AcrR family transcriptional regulator [Parabacteroides sp. PFB2-12]